MFKKDKSQRKLNGIWVPISALAHAVGVALLTWILNNNITIDFSDQTFKSVLSLLEIVVIISLICHMVSLFAIPYYFIKSKAHTHKLAMDMENDFYEKLRDELLKTVNYEDLDIFTIKEAIRELQKNERSK